MLIPQCDIFFKLMMIGVMVYVDVRSGDGCENRSQAIAHQLDMLGATVSDLCQLSAAMV